MSESMTQWVVIRTSDVHFREVMEIEGEPNYNSLSSWVDGYIEYWPTNYLVDGVIQLVVNEDGRLRGLPQNLLALELVAWAHEDPFIPSGPVGDIVAEIDMEHYRWLVGES